MTASKESPLRPMLTGVAVGFLVLGAIWLVLWLCGWRFWGLE